jgi:hypothetical protein
MSEEKPSAYSGPVREQFMRALGEVIEAHSSV